MQQLINSVVGAIVSAIASVLGILKQVWDASFGLLGVMWAMPFGNLPMISQVGFVAAIIGVGLLVYVFWELIDDTFWFLIAAFILFVGTIKEQYKLFLVGCVFSIGGAIVAISR